MRGEPPSSQLAGARLAARTGGARRIEGRRPTAAPLGAAIAFAITEYAGTEPNWKSRTGAVATHAIDTATTAAAARGADSLQPVHQARHEREDCHRRERELEAGVEQVAGLHASSTSAPRRRNHQRSRSRAQIQASDASAPRRLHARRRAGRRRRARTHRWLRAPPPGPRCADPEQPRREAATRDEQRSVPRRPAGDRAPTRGTRPRAVEPFVLAEHDSEQHRAALETPDASALPIADRSRSATPPRPPRRPTISGARPASCAWTPWRRSHVLLRSRRRSGVAR